MRGMATRWISRRIQSALSHRKTFPADGICGEWNRQTSAAWHLLYGQYNFSDVLMAFQNSVRIRCVLNGERAVDQRTDCTGFDLRPDLFLQFGKDAPFHIFGTAAQSASDQAEPAFQDRAQGDFRRFPAECCNQNPASAGSQLFKMFSESCSADAVQYRYRPDFLQESCRDYPFFC